MGSLSRRSLLRASAGLLAAGALARPHIANAAAATMTAWWTQGFIPEEDAGFKRMVADYEKTSGNTVNYTIVPFGPLGQKVISALTTGDVPDLISYDAADATILPQNSWDDKIIEVSDVVDTQKSSYLPNALLASRFYNNVKKERGFYQVPYKTTVVPFHVWGNLVEQAGYKLSDAPKTWDAYFDFFKPVQKALRAKGQRSVYACGLQLTTTGPADGNNLFYAFLIANGGKNMVTPDGKGHLDDPEVKDAVVKALTFMTSYYKDGDAPPGVLDWNDADDNNAFHAKEIVMDFDGTISTEVALYHDKEAYNAIVTQGLPQDNAGKPVPAVLAALGGFIPKGAKNVKAAKEFMTYVIQPKVTDAYLKEGLGRWLPAMPELVKSDPFWLDPKDPHRPVYVREGLMEPTIPAFHVFNPGFGVVNAEQVWGQAEADIIRNGMTPQAATEKAFKHINSILANYPIAQT